MGVSACTGDLVRRAYGLLDFFFGLSLSARSWVSKIKAPTTSKRHIGSQHGQHRTFSGLGKLCKRWTGILSGGCKIHGSSSRWHRVEIWMTRRGLISY